MRGRKAQHRSSQLGLLIGEQALEIEVGPSARAYELVKPGGGFESVDANVHPAVYIGGYGEPLQMPEEQLRVANFFLFEGSGIPALGYFGGDLDSDQRHGSVGSSGNQREIAKECKPVARAETGSNRRKGKGPIGAQDIGSQAPGASFGAKAQKLMGIALAQSRDQIASPGQRAEAQYKSNDETSSHLREARGIICDACWAKSQTAL